MATIRKRKPKRGSRAKPAPDLGAAARYAINAAKSEWRDGFNAGDVERVLAIYEDEFTDMSEQFASFYRDDAKPVLRARLEKLFRENRVEMAPVVIRVVVGGASAFAYGWHTMTLHPKSGGAAIVKRTRYAELWSRGADREWRILMCIDNADHDVELAENVIGRLARSES